MMVHLKHFSDVIHLDGRELLVIFLQRGKRKYSGIDIMMSSDDDPTCFGWHSCRSKSLDEVFNPMPDVSEEGRCDHQMLELANALQPASSCRGPLLRATEARRYKSPHVKVSIIIILLLQSHQISHIHTAPNLPLPTAPSSHTPRAKKSKKTYQIIPTALASGWQALGGFTCNFF